MRRTSDVINVMDSVKVRDKEDLSIYLRGATGQVMANNGLLLEVEISETKIPMPEWMSRRVQLQLNDVDKEPSRVYFIDSVALSSVKSVMNYCRRNLPAHMDAYVISRDNKSIVIGIRDDEGHTVIRKTATIRLR